PPRLALLDRWEAQWRQGGDVVMAMLIGGEVVGGTGLHRRRGPHRLEIGYWVDADHIGKGLATEAAAVLTTAALGCPGVTSVEIHHDKANIRSRRIPEHLGYGFTGERPDSIDAPGEIGIDCAWQMRAETWSAAGHEGPGASGGVGAS
ncbi:MAG: GNAT family N-acetyltransferase, partial [Acidimicrobiales bacterium]